MIKDNREEPKLIGSIDLSTEELLYEDCTGRINLPNGACQCKIYVYSNEGTIPHFHLISNSGESCICIYEALYFNHGNKVMKLNSKQRKILDDWLDKPSSINKSLSNWEGIDFAWQIGNGNTYVPNNPKKPDYRNMKNIRGN